MTKDNTNLFDQEMVEEARKHVAKGGADSPITIDFLQREPEVAALFTVVAEVIADGIVKGIVEGEDPSEVAKAGVIASLCHGFILREGLQACREIRDFEQYMSEPDPSDPTKDDNDESMDCGRDLPGDGSGPESPVG